MFASAGSLPKHRNVFNIQPHAHPIRHSTERRFADEFVISSEVENRATGKSDMDGCAARAAARESGDERVKSLTVFSELMEDFRIKN